MKLDFTLETYTQLCETILRVKCPVMTTWDFLAAGQPEGLSVVVRHDVDRQMGAALRMAEMESRYGIAATYYVRATPAVFKPEALRRLHEMGHEVGYHYETLARARGDEHRAIAMFEQELRRFRQVVPIHTINMHGSPLSPWNNLDLWGTYDYRAYQVGGDAGLDIDYSRLYYFTDTGRNWDAGRYNLRDRPPSLKPDRKVLSTDDLIVFLNQTQTAPVIVNAHPNRWASNWLGWSVSAASDWVINRGKLVVSWLQGRSPE